MTRSSLLNVRGKRVLVTGHTGFKGAWLSEWLLAAGARVIGIALPPESPESLFCTLRLDQRLEHTIADIRDAAVLRDAVRRADPEIVFHLAAQALVRMSYRDPLTTFSTNVVGTLNLLESLRALDHRVTAVVVTSDKVYRNREWDFAYREEDELGGHDPYSASKAACELAVASWRASFGAPDRVNVVTARAGNVIGGGDIAEDRIIPDCFRAWNAREVVLLRNPRSTRPWQHVLEPLSGYIALAAHLETAEAPVTTCNFGPGANGSRSVEELVRALAALDPDRRFAAAPSQDAPHEARSLSLTVDRAYHRLGWVPRLSFEEMVAWTNEGYVSRPDAIRSVVEQQIGLFESRAPVFDA